MRPVCARLIGLALLFALSGSPAWAQSSLHVWYEQDFAQNPLLAAQPHDVVVLDLEPGPRNKRKPEDLLRYQLRAGTHTFCLDQDDPALTDLILEDFQGRRLERLCRPQDATDCHPRTKKCPSCMHVTLPAGVYTLRVVHDGRLISGAHKVGFAQAAPTPASPSLVDNTGQLVGGWWALEASTQPGRIALGGNPWVTTAAMSTPRLDHTATLLPSGEVLVAGGFANIGDPLATAELYAPATGQWTSTETMSKAGLSHTQPLLSSGQVIVAGGSSSSALLSSAELYNPATGQWTAAGSLHVARVNHTATLLLSGQVLITGGQIVAGKS